MLGHADGWHETLPSDTRVSPPSERTFGFTFAAIFALVGGWRLWTGDALAGTCASLLAAAFVIATIARPALLAPLNRAWGRIGLLLHAVISPLALAVLFYGVVTPVGLLLRATGQDPLRRRIDPKLQSYWIAKSGSGPQTRMKDQF